MHRPVGALFQSRGFGSDPKVGPKGWETVLRYTKEEPPRGLGLTEIPGFETETHPLPNAAPWPAKAKEVKDQTAENRQIPTLRSMKSGGTLPLPG